MSFQTLTRFFGRLVLVWGIGFMNVVTEFISILSMGFRSAIPRKFPRVGDDAGEDVGRSSLNIIFIFNSHLFVDWTFTICLSLSTHFCTLFYILRVLKLRAFFLNYPLEVLIKFFSKVKVLII